MGQPTPLCHPWRANPNCPDAAKRVPSADHASSTHSSTFSAKRDGTGHIVAGRLRHPRAGRPRRKPGRQPLGLDIREAKGEAGGFVSANGCTAGHRWNVERRGSITAWAPISRGCAALTCKNNRGTFSILFTTAVKPTLCYHHSIIQFVL